MANNKTVRSATPTFTSLLRVLQIFGLTAEIGEPGEYTCYESRESNEIVCKVVPGRFSVKELKQLYRDAAYTPRTT